MLRDRLLLAESQLAKQPLAAALNRQKFQFPAERSAFDLPVRLEADDVVQAQLLAGTGQFGAGDPHHGFDAVHGGSRGKSWLK